MSLKQLVIVSILGFSSIALADDATTTTSSTTTTSVTKPADKDHARMWTIQAQEKHAAHSQSSKTVTDPGVFVIAQRDPHDKK
jgi:maltose-binding protein MalE